MMTAASGDPVAAIREDQAEGETAALYGDIRATLGVPVVNLIWRHLATFPNGLAWAWDAVRPHYRSGAVQAEARALRDHLVLVETPELSRAALRTVGISAADEIAIVRLLDTYERSNAMNLIALAALNRQLRGGGPARDAPPPARDAPPPAPSRADRPIEGNLPRLLVMDEMAPETARLVAELNRFGQADDGRIVASLYRHVAHWPGFLALAWAVLAPLQRDGRLATMIAATLDAADRRASKLAIEPSGDLPLSAAARRQIGATLTEFIDGAIGRMLPIGMVLRRAMPPAEAGHKSPN